MSVSTVRTNRVLCSYSITPRFGIMETDGIGGKFLFGHFIGCAFCPNRSFCSFFCVEPNVDANPNSSVHQFRVETEDVPWIEPLKKLTRAFHGNGATNLVKSIRSLSKMSQPFSWTKTDKTSHRRQYSTQGSFRERVPSIPVTNIICDTLNIFDKKTICHQWALSIRKQFSEWGRYLYTKNEQAR